MICAKVILILNLTIKIAFLSNLKKNIRREFDNIQFDRKCLNEKL